MRESTRPHVRAGRVVAPDPPLVAADESPAAPAPPAQAPSSVPSTEPAGRRLGWLVIGRTSFPALGTTAVVVVADAGSLALAHGLLAAEVERIDRSCSRFRDDSELVEINRRAGENVELSEDLCEAVRVALDAAAATDGLLDPTLGAELRQCGYDRTFALVAERGSWRFEPRQRPPETWRRVTLDVERRLLCVPEGVALDLGATAKALAADRAARLIAQATRGGTLVSLGGDIAVAGAAPGSGWRVLVAEAHDSPLDGPGQQIALAVGGLATSSTTERRWPTNHGEMHHLLDPSTGLPAETPWKTVSVAARSCLEANIASTAAILLGDGAPAWLTRRRLPARLVDANGSVTATGDWPLEHAA